MSSLKDDVDKTQSSWPESPSIQSCRTQNNFDMSVTAPVSHVEMWPHSRLGGGLVGKPPATAVLMLSSPNAPLKSVGASVTRVCHPQNGPARRRTTSARTACRRTRRRGSRRCRRTS